ncbi:MAG: ABC transporter permease [Lachnospiraceae bacterium]
MFTFIKQKLLYKKWLNACLLIGIIILAAVAACIPMYQNMSKIQTFQNQMKEYVSTEGRYPAMVSLFRGSTYKDGSKAYEKASKKVKELEEMLDKDMQIKPLERITLYTLLEDRVKPLKNAGGSKAETNYRISFLPGFSNHIRLASGNLYENSAEVKEAAKKSESAGAGIVSIDDSTKYTCVVSAALLANGSFYVGQTLEFSKIVCKDGSPLRITITGVFEEKEEEDIYWVEPPASYTSHLFVSEDMFQEILADIDGQMTIRYQIYNLYDYKHMKLKELPVIYKALERYKTAGFDDDKVEITTDFDALLKDYMDQEKQIQAVLWILELPIMVLVLVFIYMISAQILELEGNEIATLKSRGVSIRQIVFIYFCQASILAGIGMVIGMPLGYGLCRLLGQANAFLEFVNRENLPVHFTGMTLVYCLVASAFAIAFMTLPLLRIAQADIVTKKSKRGKADKSIFERYYLDVALLAVSGYAYYSFRGQRSEIASKVLNGDGLDPFLFLSAVLFMLGFGMVILRIFRLLANLIYHIGRKKWSPALYASFLQILRTRGKQSFISLFLVVALAMGVFYSNVARTINQNEEERTYYNLGADMVLKEEWIKTSNTYKKGDKKVTELYYAEPSTNLFEKVKEQSESAAKVIKRDVSIKGSKDLTDNGMLMAVQTKEFGETAWMRDGVLDKHWYYYLNDLAANAQNVLVSSNAEIEFGLKAGDTISYSLFSEEEGYKDTMGTVTGTICGFVDAWPGYTGYKTVVDENGKKTQEPVYLVVANLGFIESTSGTQPCEIWVNTGENNKGIYDVISQNNIRMEYVKEAKQNLTLVKQSAMIQITNGMLTLSFLVVLVLCMIGFLIYWITSIRQRELLFGIYRAMGMSMKEIIEMLINEQIFCSLLAILCGVISGAVTSKIFISLITVAYAPENHCLPYTLYTSAADMVRIGVVVICMLDSCIFILAKMLSRMRIAQAIKLGED